MELLQRLVTVFSGSGTKVEALPETIVMTEKQPSQDPNLSAPQEANTTKHINFLDAEEDTTSPRSDDAEEESPTQKAWKELRNDEKK